MTSTRDQPGEFCAGGLSGQLPSAGVVGSLDWRTGVCAEFKRPEITTDWFTEATTFGNCSCDYNFACQSELRPTHGSCRGVEVSQIERGYFGTVQLDGLFYAVTCAWPGVIFEGNGAMQAIIDERADDKQRDGLLTVLHGGETDEAKTHWWVFHAMSSTVHEPIFRRTQWLQGRQLRLKSRSSARRGRAICHRARPSERPLASQGWPLTRVAGRASIWGGASQGKLALGGPPSRRGKRLGTVAWPEKIRSSPAGSSLPAAQDRRLNPALH